TFAATPTTSHGAPATRSPSSTQTTTTSSAASTWGVSGGLCKGSWRSWCRGSSLEGDRERLDLLFPARTSGPDVGPPVFLQVRRELRGSWWMLPSSATIHTSYCAPKADDRPGRFDRKVAFVTGGSSGIGEAAARLLAADGAHVALADVQQELGQQVAASVRAAGGEGLCGRGE